MAGAAPVGGTADTGLREKQMLSYSTPATTKPAVAGDPVRQDDTHERYLVSRVAIEKELSSVFHLPSSSIFHLSSSPGRAEVTEG
jgi:hypothetical protein